MLEMQQTGDGSVVTAQLTVWRSKRVAVQRRKPRKLRSYPEFRMQSQLFGEAVKLQFTKDSATAVKNSQRKSARELHMVPSSLEPRTGQRMHVRIIQEQNQPKGI